jgi:hypothetical protein
MVDHLPTRHIRQGFIAAANSHVQLINLTGPNNAKATAYSCSMNVDVDGEPQAYGPADKRRFRATVLQDAGWLAPAKNTEKDGV